MICAGRVGERRGRPGRATKLVANGTVAARIGVLFGVGDGQARVDRLRRLALDVGQVAGGGGEDDGAWLGGATATVKVRRDRRRRWRCRRCPSR